MSAKRSSRNEAFDALYILTLNVHTAPFRRPANAVDVGLFTGVGRTFEECDSLDELFFVMCDGLGHSRRWTSRG